jgi:hypothetical protein
VKFTRPVVNVVVYNSQYSSLIVSWTTKQHIEVAFEDGEVDKVVEPFVEVVCSGFLGGVKLGVDVNVARGDDNLEDGVVDVEKDVDGDVVFVKGEVAEAV